MVKTPLPPRLRPLQRKHTFFRLRRSYTVVFFQSAYPLSTLETKNAKNTCHKNHELVSTQCGRLYFSLVFFLDGCLQCGPLFLMFSLLLLALLGQCWWGSQMRWIFSWSIKIKNYLTFICLIFVFIISGVCQQIAFWIPLDTIHSCPTWYLMDWPSSFNICLKC